MAAELPPDARELVEHFAGLPAEDRARILALVRSLSVCRTAELYSIRWAVPEAARALGATSPEVPSPPRGTA